MTTNETEEKAIRAYGLACAREAMRGGVSEPYSAHKVSDVLPPDGEWVIVYTPDEDEADGWRYDFDCVEDGAWVAHSNSYEHFVIVGGAGAAGPDCPCTGPSEEAPYTHWSRFPRPGTAPPAGSVDVTEGYYLATFKQRARGGEILWWGPNNCGYTPDIKQAGIYTEITTGYHDSDVTVPVPVSFMRGRRVRGIVDPGDSDNAMFWSASQLRAALTAALQEPANDR